DAVLVHGDPKLISFEASFPAAPDIADRLIYTGYVYEAEDVLSAHGPPPPPPPQRGGAKVGSTRGAGRGAGRVVCAGRGGRVGRESDWSPATLATAIERAAARQPATVMVNTDGAANSARIIAALIDGCPVGYLAAKTGKAMIGQ